MPNPIEVNVVPNILLESSELVQHLFHVLKYAKSKCTPISLMLPENARIARVKFTFMDLSTTLGDFRW